MLTKSTNAFINKYHKDIVFDGTFKADGSTKNICYSIEYLITKNVFMQGNSKLFTQLILFTIVF